MDICRWSLVAIKKKSTALVQERICAIYCRAVKKQFDSSYCNSFNSEIESEIRLFLISLAALAFWCFKTLPVCLALYCFKISIMIIFFLFPNSSSFTLSQMSWNTGTSSSSNWEELTQHGSLSLCFRGHSPSCSMSYIVCLTALV